MCFAPAGHCWQVQVSAGPHPGRQRPRCTSSSVVPLPRGILPTQRRLSAGHEGRMSIFIHAFGLSLRVSDVELQTPCVLPRRHAAAVHILNRTWNAWYLSRGAPSQRGMVLVKQMF